MHLSHRGSIVAVASKAGGSVVVGLVFYVPPIVCGGSVLIFVWVCITSKFFNHLDEEERAVCFAFIVLWMFYYSKYL